MTCDISAHATMRATPARLELLRRDPGRALRPAALRHADDQSVLGLATVLTALRTAAMDADQCAMWGVVAAPRFLGRNVMAAALERFAAEGACSVSPHILPHQSQHAVAAFISQILGIQGPSLGVGGGPDVGVEAALTATALLQREQIPGAWLVMTGWNPEAVADDRGCLPPHVECQALALGLTLTQASQQRPRLRVCPDLVPTGAADRAGADHAWFSGVEQLENALDAIKDKTRFRTPSVPTSMILALSSGAWIEMGPAGPSADLERGPKGRSLETSYQ